MTRTSQIQFVSAGLLQPKKRDHTLARRQLYLNYGALSLASQLNLHGYDVALRHGEHHDPVTFAEALHAEGRLPSTWPLLVSIPSFYALEWTQAFCRAVKHIDRAARIIVGGRWVTGPDPAWLGGLLPQADLIVPGLGEDVIWEVLGLPVPPGARTGQAMPDFGLRHRLVDDFRRFQPSLETSRGCGMKCAFCEERDIPLSSLRQPNRVADLLAATAEEYGADDIRPYFQSSFFLPNPRWALSLQQAFAERGLAIKWRCETRVDGMKPETVAALSESGLRVIDLGLETASPAQISAMRKSGDPDRYLRSASRLLEACAANGVWAKVNVLLYGGETEETLQETRDWLDHHSAAIKGVSAGPVVAFGPPTQVSPFLRDLASLGAAPVDRDSAATTGITQLHLGPDMDAARAERVSLELSRRYMDTDAYFDLKSFSYYPRDYSRADFEKDISASDAERLPFRVS